MPKLPSKNGTKRVVQTNTLLIDGNSLFKWGFHGAKDEYNHRGEHIGGVYQFLTILRKLLTEDIYHRVYVFWDGKLSGQLRYKIYSEYKGDRNKDFINGTHPVDESELKQKKMLWNYLEDLCIRQLQDEVVESDDYIAYYTNNKGANENITICTTDRDMSQLIQENVRIYFCDLRAYIDATNYSTYFAHYYENACLLKTITGDNSDCIKGVRGVKEPTLLTFFPELKERKVTLNEIIEKAGELQEERVKNKKTRLKSLDNLVNGVTLGVQGDKLYEINDKLVNLSHPMMTPKAIENLEFIMEGEFNFDERGIKNVYVKMKIDGIDRTIGSNRYPDYLIPFKQLMEREQKQNTL